MWIGWKWLGAGALIGAVVWLTLRLREQEAMLAQLQMQCSQAAEQNRQMQARWNADLARLSTQRSQKSPLPAERIDDLRQIQGIGKVYAERLARGGFRTYAAVAAATPEQLRQACPSRAPLPPDYAGWIAAARQLAPSHETS
ncbi:MAG: helix-hairpin-helix domain-containing protein [Caldilinea sp.]|jgi:predicted flap endonuclease-1-like 5' DNA nuclease